MEPRTPQKVTDSIYTPIFLRWVIGVVRKLQFSEQLPYETAKYVVFCRTCETTQTKGSTKLSNKSNVPTYKVLLRLVLRQASNVEGMNFEDAFCQRDNYRFTASCTASFTPSDTGIRPLGSSRGVPPRCCPTSARSRIAWRMRLLPVSGSKPQC